MANCQKQDGPYSCDIAAGNYALNSPMSVHRVDADGNPDPNGAYVQGWFMLPGGKASDTYLGMTDADFVSAADPNEPLYESYMADCGIGQCHRVQGNAHGTGDMYKLGDGQTVTITGDMGYLNLNVSGWGWDPNPKKWGDEAGWKTCTYQPTSNPAGQPGCAGALH